MGERVLRLGAHMGAVSIIGKFLILIVVSWSLPLLAGSTITIFGSRSCETWVKDKRAAALAAPTEFKSIAVVGNKTWLAGYLSGYNENFLPGRDLLDLVDFSTAEEWVDEYCQKNPKSSVRSAVQDLFRRLEKMSKK